MREKLLIEVIAGNVTAFSSARRQLLTPQPQRVFPREDSQVTKMVSDPRGGPVAATYPIVDDYRAWAWQMIGDRLWEDNAGSGGIPPRSHKNCVCGLSCCQECQAAVAGRF